MKSYIITTNRYMIYAFMLIGLALYLLDFLGLFKNGRYLSYIVFCLMVYNFVKFFSKGIFRISFSNENCITIDKYKYFKYETLKLNVLELKYKYKRRISYPNEYYELYFVYGDNNILINSSGGEFFSFSESDEKEILKKIEELNIKKIE